MLDYCFIFNTELLAQINRQSYQWALMYLSHLLKLEKSLPKAIPAPDSDKLVLNPLKSVKWTLELSAHLDKQLVAYILHGIHCGF